MIFGRFKAFFNISEYPLFKNNARNKKNSISMFVSKPTLLESKIDNILMPLKNH